VLLAGRDFNTCAGLQDEAVLLHFNGQLSFKNVEELAGTEVKMPNLTRAGWHELFDDAEIGCPDEMPAVARVSLRTTPLIVFGGLLTDDQTHREIVPVAG
jgi:hypothetical protein